MVVHVAYISALCLALIPCVLFYGAYIGADKAHERETKRHDEALAAASRLMRENLDLTREIARLTREKAARPVKRRDLDCALLDVFHNDLTRLVKEYAAAELTNSEMLGALEFVKLNLFYSLPDNDEEEDPDGDAEPESETTV